MSCSDTRHRLPAFLGGTLAPDEAGELARHVVGCEPCRAALLSARVPLHDLPSCGPEDPGFWEPMDQAILAELERVPPPRRPPGGPLRWLGAEVPTRRSTLLALSTALALALAWGYTRSPSPAPPAALLTPAATSPAEPPPARPELRPAAHVPAHGSL